MGRISNPAKRACLDVEPLEDRRLLSATLVADILPRPPYDQTSNNPGPVYDVGGLMLFVASDGVHGRELWRTDGSAKGTRMVKDLVPGPNYLGADSFTAFDGAVYFFSDNALWRTDGSERGTFVVQHDQRARYFSEPSQLTAYNGALYFIDHDSTGAARLWRTDGTPDGLSRVLPFAKPTAAENHILNQLVPLGDALTFVYGNALWRTDGTRGGTFRIGDGVVVTGDVHRLGDTLLFPGRAGTTNGLWRTDGTAAGTWLVKGMEFSATAGLVGDGIVHGDTLYFSGRDPDHGTELWKSDGTTAGTVMVADVLPSKPPGGFVPAGLMMDSVIIFNPPLPPSHPFNSEPSNFHIAGGRVVFTAGTPNQGTQLFSTDGTASGTVQLASLGSYASSYGGGASSAYREFRNVGDALFFTTQTHFEDPGALYVTDGTPHGTRRIWTPDFSSNTGGGGIYGLASAGGSLYFAAWSWQYGRELMRWDDTGSMTGLAYDDANANGVRDRSELPLAGWRVFLDRNGNGIFNKGETFSFTGEDGAYGFPAFPDGEYSLRVSRPDDGWRNPTVPSSVQRGRTSWRDVAATRITPLYGSIFGNIFNDTDFDGTRDASDISAHEPGEGAREGFRVYIDLNLNGYRSPGEPSAFTDADGNYRFDEVLPGRYAVRIPELGEGYEYTSGLEQQVLVPAGSAQEVDFGVGYDGSDGVISGSVFHDRDGDGQRDAGEDGFGGLVLYLDKNNDRRLSAGERSVTTDAEGHYSFGGLRHGTHRLRQVAFPGGTWRLTTAGNHTFGLGVAAVGTMSFGFEPAGTISGYVFSDVNGNGFPKAAAGEIGLDGWGVYSDLNDDGQRNFDEPLTWSGPDGFYEFELLKLGTHRLRVIPRWDRVGWLATTPLSHLTVSLSAGESVERSLGIAAGGRITGSIFHDLNYDGVRQDDEPPIAGVTVTLTRTYRNKPSPRAVSPVTTGDDGTFQFDGVYQGSWNLAPGFAKDWRHIGYNPTVFVSPSSALPVGPIAAAKVPQISGTLFKDLNGDGTSNPGEPRLPGYTVYVDKDNDARLDANEPRFTSTATGVFHFADLTSDPATLRYVPQVGDGLSNHSISIDLAAPGMTRLTWFGARLEG
jgi:ELWxxDGT repeat protein